MIKKIHQLIPHSAVNISLHLPRAIVANIKSGFPGRKIRVIGVTGTDGKTTTVHMIYTILKSAGKSVSLISTVGAVIAGKEYDTGYHTTTPTALVLQGLLKRSLEAGDELMVLEVTSHSLEQFRVWGVNFEVGVITNITHEHLDYHKTWENYFQAKAKLIKNTPLAVLNYDDLSFKRLARIALGRVITFGQNKSSNFNPQNFPLKLQVPGEFNVLNALAAAAATDALGIDPKVIKSSLASFTGVVGRLEEIKNKKNIKVYVDFAHTPNALENGLRALRQKSSGRLIAVFGASAERDVEKRPIMGKVAAEIADVVILTDDDPRFEDRHKIINEIAEGSCQAGAVESRNLFKQPNRVEAIRMALQMAKKGDTVGLFGKGHEKSMSFRGEEKPWSDQKVAADLLQKGKTSYSYTQD